MQSKLSEVKQITCLLITPLSKILKHKISDPLLAESNNKCSFFVIKASQLIHYILSTVPKTFLTYYRVTYWH